MISELVHVHGHIIDSLILPKILDEIMDQGGAFDILRIRIGKRTRDPSEATLKVSAASRARLNAILTRIARLGAMPMATRDAQLVPAQKPGVFPATFYATTNLPTSVRVGGRWLPVQQIEMDCGVVVEKASRRALRAQCTPMADVRPGDLVVCGAHGVKVAPLERARSKDPFAFMTSAVSSEKPKAQLIADVARAMRLARRRGRHVLVVGGPAIIHTGGGPWLERLIEGGYVQALFAGNGLATHDIETALFGTSLGIDLRRGMPTKDGHDHHLRAINTIRGCGSIAQAVRRGILTKGVLHACVTHRVPFVLAGSIRDDGPLPDVITDTLRAQAAMRRHIPGLGLALMVGSTLHAIATGNMLPATVKTVCVDINPAVVTKLADRGTFQGIGIVLDAASFLRELCLALKLAK